MSTKVDFSQIKNKRLAGLDDVNATSPSDGHVLTYNAQTHKWVPQAIQVGGNNVMFVELTEENDEWSCNLPIAKITEAMAEGKMVYGVMPIYGNIVFPISMYYADEYTRIAVFVFHIGLNYFELTGESQQENGVWTDDEWTYDENMATLDSLTGVSAGSPLDGQGLIYNGSTQQWVPGNLPSGGGAAAVFSITDDGQGNITLALANTSSTLGLTDDGNGNITLTIS